MDFKQQYEFVKSSRKVLLGYCQNIAASDFLVENNSFGRGSIRNLLVHTGNTYEFWLGRHALGKNVKFTESSSITNALAAEAYFQTVDALVEEFGNVYASKYLDDLHMKVNDTIMVASPMKLFLHVITHEFHHKGQILSLSRRLGYVPVDTDIIR